MTSPHLARALILGLALCLGAVGAKSVTDAFAQGAGSGSGAAKGSGSGSGSGSAAGHAAQAKGDDSPSSKAFAEANAKMHKEMDIVFSGDADVDFVKGMIPHHAGAVDMARIVIKYGKDPDLKKLAESIISAQESEIVFMRAWLQKMGK